MKPYQAYHLPMLKVKSRHSNFQLEFKANIVGRVRYQISARTLKMIEKLEPDLKLADSQTSYSNVDILIGGWVTKNLSATFHSKNRRLAG